MRFLLVLTLFIVVSLFTSAQPCDSLSLAPDSLQWVAAGGTNGGVYAMERYKDTLYLGGDFTYVGKYTGSLVRYDLNAADLNTQPWPKTNGRINAIISDGSGGVIIVGDFTRVGDSMRTDIAQISAAGVVTPFSANIEGYIQTAVSNNGTVYIGGEFSRVNGQNRSNLAAIALSNSTLSSWSPTLNGKVSSIVSDGTNLYTGGNFTSIGTTSRSALASFDLTTGVLTSLNMPLTHTSATAEAKTLLIHQNKLYIGGTFLQVNNITRQHLASISLPAGTLTAWNPSVRSTEEVMVMIARNDTIFVGGHFTYIGTDYRTNLASIHATTGARYNFLPGFDHSHYITALALYNDRLYVGGYFDMPWSNPMTNIAVYNINSNVNGITNLNTYKEYADVSALYVSGTTLYIGGRFASMGGEKRNKMAAINVKNNKLLPLNLATQIKGNFISALKVSQDKLYIGGYMTYNNYNEGILQLNIANSYSVTPWNNIIALVSTPNNFINSIEVSASHVYIGGRYSSPQNGVNYKNLMRITKSTNTADTWNPVFFNNNMLSPQEVTSIKYAGSRLYIGGKFGTNITSLKGNFMYTDFASNADEYVHFNGGINAVYHSADKLYLGGNFTEANLLTRNSVASIDTTAAMTINKWNPNILGSVSAILQDRDRVYVGGNFTQAGGKTRNSFAVVDTVTGALWPWNPSFTNLNAFTWNAPNTSRQPLKAIVSFGDTVFVAGDFDDISGKNITGIGRFHFNNYQLPNVTVTTPENPACGGRSITLTATSNISATNFEWAVNGSTVANTATYNYIPQNGDIIVCKTTVTGTGCFVKTTATDTLKMQVQQPISPAIMITGPAKQANGGTVALTATLSTISTNYIIDWKNNNLSIGTSTGTAFSYTKGIGNDNITATIKPDGCYDTAVSNILQIQETVGINDLATANKINIYPNPVQDQLIITGAAKGDIVQLTDVLGRNLQQWQIAVNASLQQLPFTGVQKGAYILKITDANGRLKACQPLQK